MCDEACYRVVPSGDLGWMRNVETGELANITMMDGGMLKGYTVDMWTRRLTGAALADCVDLDCPVYWCPLDVEFFSASAGERIEVPA